MILAGFLTMGAARDAEAQLVPYTGMGVERAPVGGPPVEGLSGTNGLRALFLLGLRHESQAAPRAAHGIEFEIGWLNEQREQANWTPAQGEAPIRLELTAWTMTGSYRLIAPVRRWPLRPFVRVGGTWGRLTDEGSSDTPAEQTTTSLWGAHAGGGVEARVGFGLRLSLTGTYTSYADSDDRPLLSLDLGGWSVGARIGVDL